MTSENLHQGGCHCGAVRYSVELDLAQPVIACNCSMCGRSGTLLAFVPASAFTLAQGEASLSDYRFNKKSIAHLFCKTCGIKSFGRGEGPHGPMIAVNTRCLDGIDVSSLTVQQVDGRSY